MNQNNYEYYNGNTGYNTDYQNAQVNNTMQKYYNGERVDMTDSMSILTYGNQLIEEISKIRENIYVNDSGDKIGQSLSAIQTKITNVGEFNTRLDEEDEKREKQEKRFEKLNNIPFIGRKINKLLGTTAFLDRDTYKDALNQQNDTVSEITAAVEKNAQHAAEAHRYNKDYLVKLEEKLKELKQLIDFGNEDLETFEKQIEIMKQEGPSIEDDEVLFNARIEQADKHIFLFRNKLAGLESARLTSGQLFAQTLQKQTVYGQLMQQFYEVKTLLLPILSSTAKEAIDTRQQNEMLQLSNSVIQGTNEAIIKNSQQVYNNVQLSQNMMEKGTLYTSTIVDCGKNIESAAKIIANGKQALAKALDDRQRINAQVDASLNNAIHTMRQAIENDTTENKLLQGVKLPELPVIENGPKVKQLGTMPNSGNK